MSQKTIMDILMSDTTKKYLYECDIQHLWIFGSRAKSTHTPTSDVDLLYQLSSDKKRTGLNFFRGMAFLQEMLHIGVDMVSIDHIHPDIKQEVLSSKIALW